MRTPIFHVDAFTTRPFAGNPAAVMPMDEFPADTVLQDIAAENNLSETAFLVPEGIACVGSHPSPKYHFAATPRWPVPQS
jgi:PhzF family phenazine biosynthesis protein